VCLSVFGTLMSRAKTDKQIEMPFEGPTSVDLRNYVLDGVAHRCHLANTTECFVRGGDAAIRQISFTTGPTCFT